MWLLCYRFCVYLFIRHFYYYNANRGISIKALYVLKGNCPCWFKRKKEKKRYSYFSLRDLSSLKG
jgi:hypothetical protein